MSSSDLTKEIGLVRANKHYLASIEGLPSARVHDIIINEEGQRALVTALSHDAVEAMMLDTVEVRPGQQFELYPQAHQLSLGEHLFGRVINAVGDPIDSKGSFPPKNMPLVLEREAGDLARRAAIHDQLVTGIAMIDTVLPIGKGQRQLLMGPVRSGTDSFCRDIIYNQADSDMVCIYGAIGKPANYVRRIAEDLFEGPAAKYTIMIASTSEDPAPLSTIVPSVAIYMAEYFSGEGKDVLLVLDDLYTHAKYLREIALLEGYLPGRESYPGDIFYRQAHLIERAGNFTGKGSITMLPVLQTDIESATDLIQTNLMGTTDGHLLFDSSLYAQGSFPPVQEEESVTRVGKHTQTIVQKQLSSAIMSLLAEAKEQEKYTQFGTQVSDNTQHVIMMGRAIRTLLKQGERDRLNIETQTILLASVFTTLSSDKDAGFFSKNKLALTEGIAKRRSFAEIKKRVHTDKTLDEFIAALEKHVPTLTKLCRS